jgi:hypothetical protein
MQHISVDDDLQSSIEDLVRNVGLDARSIRLWAIGIQRETGRGVSVTVVGATVVAWFSTSEPQELEY